ncbi:MAG: hypothetical protein NW900_02080 [Candidatus Blochmannia sp. A2]|nr:hypothetical protein [Candidatus Blochmannia sp. A2]
MNFKKYYIYIYVCMYVCIYVCMYQVIIVEESHIGQERSLLCAYITGLTFNP